MSGGGSSQTSKTEPWEGLKPFLTQIYGEGQKLYEGGNPYQSQFVGMNTGQQNALSNIYAKGMTDSPLIGSAGSFLQNQMNTGGGYANSPAYGGMLNLASGGMVPTGYGQYGGKQNSFMEQAQGMGSAPQTGYDFAGGGQAITDALSKWGKINATDTGTLNAARPEVVGTGFGDKADFGIGRFSDEAYLAANPDLTAEALKANNLTAAQHYDQYGATEKRDLGIGSTSAGAISPEEQLQLATNLIRLGKNDSGYVDTYMKEVADKGGFNPFAGLTEEQLTTAMQGQFANGANIAEYAPGNIPQETQGGSSGGNPFLDATFANAAFPVANQYMTSTAPTIDAAFSRAGRYGSGMQGVAQNNAADTLGRNLSGLASSIYGGAYESERNRQVQGLGMLQNAYDTGQGRALTSAGMAPGLENSQMQNYMQAFNAAGQYQNQDKAYLADQQNMAMGPYNWLQQYAGLLNGSPGGFGTSTTSSGGGNAFGTALQGVGTAAQIAALIPWSSRTLKDIVAPVDPDAILEKVANLDVGRWKYKPVTPHSVTMPGEHIGPYAEDFKDAFEVGDGHHINLLDAVGVLFGAVKALATRVKELEAERV